MPGKSWHMSEIQSLTQSIRRALAPSEISLPGRTPQAIRRMAVRLGLVGDGISRKKWSMSERHRLEDLVRSGLTASRIAEQDLLPGHNRNAIQKQMQRMGLGRFELSQAQKLAVRMRGKMLDRFHAFLREHVRAYTPAQIVELWNRSNPSAVTHRKVVYHLTEIGLRLPRNLVLRMTNSTARQTGRSAESMGLGTADVLPRERTAGGWEYAGVG